VKISWEQIGNRTNPTPRSSLTRKKAWAHRVNDASHDWLQEIFLPTGVLCRCWRTLGNGTGKNDGCILMYICSVYHTPNTVWNLERTFSTQRSTQKHSEKFLVHLEGTVHKLIRTRTRKIWHLSVLTSRYILLQKSHKTRFSFSRYDLKNWQKQTNKQTHTNNSTLHNYFDILVALILFLSSTHFYCHASFLRRNIT
jgi:hypothetical protein